MAMTLDDNTNKIIEDYLSNRLSEAAKQSFEQQIASDENLKKAVDLEKLIKASVIKSESDKLRLRMKKIHKNQIDNSTQKSNKTIPMSKKIIPFVSIAATLVILVGAFFLFQSDSADVSQNDPIAKYLNSKDTYTQSAINSFGTRGGTTPSEDEKIKKLKTIFTLIDKGDYSKAKPILDSYIADFPEDEEGKYAKAKIYLDEAEYGNAIVWFSKIRKSDNRELRNEAEFYYGLCHYMIVDGESTAKQVLQTVAKDNRSDWQDAAKGVLANRE